MSERGAVLLGVDVGTTNVKASAFFLNGALAASASHRLPVLRTQPGWAEYDPDQLVTTTAATIHSVVEQLDNIHILGIAVASMAETAVPVDKQGNSLHNAIAWHDERTDRRPGGTKKWERSASTASQAYRSCPFSGFRSYYGSGATSRISLDEFTVG